MSAWNLPARTANGEPPLSAERTLLSHQVGDLVWRAADWTRGVLAGEFAKKREVGQIIADAVLSMFPVVGEMTATRDLIAIVFRMVDHEESRKDPWEWVSIVLCLIVVFPVFGGVIKGVGKLLQRAIRTSDDAVRVCQEILAFLRKMGVGDVDKWLAKLDFTKFQKALIDAFGELISRLSNACRYITETAGWTLPAGVKHYLLGLPEKLDELKTLSALMIPQSLKDLNALLNRVRAKMVAGTWADVSVGERGAWVMTDEARLAELATDPGVSVGNLPQKNSSYLPENGWPNLEDSKYDRPIPTFSIKSPIIARTLKPGENLTRVVDTSKLKKPFTINGRYWTCKLPASGRDWRIGCAVKHSWNMNGGYVDFTIPTISDMRKAGITVADDWDGMRVWEGRIAEQLDDTNSSANTTMRLFPGGEKQYFVDFSHVSNAPIESWIFHAVKVQPTGWNDVYIPSHTQAKSIRLTKIELSPKKISEGYLRRSARQSELETREESK